MILVKQYTLLGYFILPFPFGEIHCVWACAFLQLILGGKQTFSQGKMARHCAVTGCSNGDFPLDRWRKVWCKVHNCLNSNPPCSCEPPFQLFNFPTAKKHPEWRFLWCKHVNKALSNQSTKVMDTRAKIEDLFKPPSHLLKKECRQHWVKKGKQELLLMVYLPYKIYPNRVRMKTFQELLLKKKIN